MAEKDPLFDDIILEVDECDKGMRKDREGSNSSDRSFLFAAKEIRSAALSRHRTSSMIAEIEFLN